MTLNGSEATATLAAPSRKTVREAGEALIAGMRSGTVRTRKGQRVYKPSAIRSYQSDLEKHVYPVLGDYRLSEVRRCDVQELVDNLLGQGFSGSKVRNVVTALKVVYRREVEDDELTVNPTLNLRLPEAAGEHEWDANPEEALALLEALGEERALFATALLGGLRRGELKALRVCDLHGLDVEAGERWISVERGWDDREGPVAPKSKAGTRLTLLCETLRVILAEHVERTGRGGSELVFGRSATAPFVDWTIAAHASEAWAAAAIGAFLRGERSAFERVTLHQCRHGFDSFLDAAGISEARADRYMGHAGTTVGDRYRHRLRGQLAGDAQLLEAYLHAEAAKVVALPTGAETGASAAEAAPLSGVG